MKKITKFFTFSLIVLFVQICMAQGSWNNLEYNPDQENIEYNPLKGLMPSFPGVSNDFPSSTEKFYIPLNEVFKNWNTYDWSALEDLMNKAAEKGHHCIPRFYMDYPGRTFAMPEFLRSSVSSNSYTSHGNSSSRSPDYKSEILMRALEEFIAAFGKRYNNDPRMGFIDIGLYGFWGEWHVYPNSDFEMPQANKDRLLSAYLNAFPNKKVMVRDPEATQNNSLKNSYGYYDDSFGLSTLNINWGFWEKMKRNGLTNSWKTHPMAGEVHPSIDEKDLFAKWPYVNGEYNNNFEDCIRTTHATVMVKHGLFSNGNLNSTEYGNALRATKLMGYQFFVKSVKLSPQPNNKVNVELNIQNRGIAPFYYDWKVELGAINTANGSFKSISTSSFNLPNMLPSTEDYYRSAITSTLPNGDYKIVMRVQNPLKTKTSAAKALRFANTSQDADLNEWITLGTVSIGSDTIEEDITAPTIALTGNSTINLTVGDTYTEQGATATDNIDGDLTSDIVISGNVNTNEAGEYTVTYNVSDAAGNAATEISRTIIVSEEEDTIAPIITLIGESTINLFVGDTYTEQSATATDAVDGDLTSNIVILGNINTDEVGEYTVTYNVSDAAGNAANEVIRTIIVQKNCTVGASCDDNDETTENDVFNADCNCAGTPIVISQSAYQGINGLIPGKIEAENYDLGGQGVAYNDFSKGNNGSEYRDDNVDIRTISTGRGGYQVGWSVNGEWMEYTTNVTAGEYDIELRASSGSSNPGAVKVALDGISLGTINIESTGSYDTFKSFVISNVELTGGQDKVLRLSYEGNDFDIDWIQFSEVEDNEDTTAPVITLVGESTINLSVGDTYTEQGATAIDAVDGNLTSNIIISGAINTDEAGEYTVSYNVSDAAGNAADEVTRTVIVSANSGTQMPTASFSGISQNANLAVGSSIMPVVNVSYANGSIVNVKLYINDQYVRREQLPPYEWGHTKDRDALLKNLQQGAYRLKAEVEDSNGGVTVITLDFTVGDDTTSSNEDANLLPINDAFLENDRRRYNTDIVRVERNRRVAYLMFDVSQYNGNASNAVLQFKVASDAGYGNVNVYLGTSNAWNENNLDNSNKPGIGELLGSIDSRYAIGSVIEIPLPNLPAITGDRLSLILEATDGNDFAFSSKESGTANASVLKYKIPLKASKYEAIKVYPNPSSNVVTLDKVERENTELWVYDIYGKVVLQKIVSPTSKTIEISELSTGLYFIFLDGIQRAKFIRE